MGNECGVQNGDGRDNLVIKVSKVTEDYDLILTPALSKNESETREEKYTFPPKLKLEDANTAPNTPEKEFRESPTHQMQSEMWDSPSQRVTAFNPDKHRPHHDYSPTSSRFPSRRLRRSPSVFLERLLCQIDDQLAEGLMECFEKTDRDGDGFITSAELCQLLFNINSDFGAEVCPKALENTLEGMLPTYSRGEHSAWNMEAFLEFMHTLERR